MILSAKAQLSSLGRTVEELTNEQIERLQANIYELGLMTFNKMQELASKRLHGTRSQFINALSFTKDSPNVSTIRLDKDAYHLDEGYPGFNMLPKLAQGPASRKTKDGCVLNPRNKVLTNLGWVKIKDIKVGDLVLTHSGKYREVKELLIQDAGVGTEYVRLFPACQDRTTSGNASKKNNDLTAPSLSLTLEHLVLTKDGWRKAGDLVKGDFIATPADLKRLCVVCNEPLPINAPKVVCCINNHCAHIKAVNDGRCFNFTPKERTENGKKGAAVFNAMVLAGTTRKIVKSSHFSHANWGARNPVHLKKMREGSIKAMRDKISSGKWHPEVYFEEKLLGVDLVINNDFIREFPIKTGRIGKNGKATTQFLDFYFPKLKLAIELDGKHWHIMPAAIERDAAKDDYCLSNGIRLIRIPSHKIYAKAKDLATHIALWGKNHSGELGVAWIKLGRIVRGVVNRPDHVFSKKYDIVLDAEEHSFCCETVFIHNSGRYVIIPFRQNSEPTNPSNQGQVELSAALSRVNSSRNKGNWKQYKSFVNAASGKLQTAERNDKAGDEHPNLSGLVRFREYAGGSGSRPSSSTKMTFRVASTKKPFKFVHPGFIGAKIFQEAERWVLVEFEKILKDSVE